MTNRSITLSRELVDAAAVAVGEWGDSLISRCNAGHGAAMLDLERELRDVLNAGPVPPAGGKPDPIIAVLKGHLADGMNPMFSGGDLKHLIGLLEAGTRLQAELKTALEACDDYGVQVVALRAEVERLKQAHRDELAKRLVGEVKFESLQSELTKARELLSKAVEDAGGYLPGISEFLSNQSAPADKGQGEPATYSSTQATNCAGCGKYKHTPLRVDGMGGYVCLTCIDERLEELLDAEQPAPVAVVMPDDWSDQLFAEMERRFGLSEQYHQDRLVNDDTQIGVEFAIEWIAACLDEVARLNSEPKP